MNLHREGEKKLTWRQDKDGGWLVEVVGLDIVGYGRKREVAAFTLSLSAMDFALAVLRAPDYYADLIDGPETLTLLQNIAGCPNLVAVRRMLGLPSLEMLGLVSLQLRRIGGAGQKTTRSYTGRVVKKLSRRERFARSVARQLVGRYGFTAAQAAAAVQAAGFRRHLAMDIEYTAYRGAEYWASRLVKTATRIASGCSAVDA